MHFAVLCIGTSLYLGGVPLFHGNNVNNGGDLKWTRFWGKWYSEIVCFVLKWRFPGLLVLKDISTILRFSPGAMSGFFVLVDFSCWVHYMQLVIWRRSKSFLFHFRGKLRDGNHKCAAPKMPTRSYTNECHTDARTTRGKIFAPWDGRGHGDLYPDVLW